MTAGERIAGLLLRRNRLFLWIMVVCLAVLAAGLPRLTFSADNRAFFGRDNPEFRELRRVEAIYASTDGLLFLAVPPEGASFAPDSLETLRDLTEAAWYIPYVLRVDSAANHTHSRADGDEIRVEALLPDDGPVGPAEAARFRDLAVSLEELAGRYVAEDGSAYGIGVQLVIPDEPGASDAVAAHVAELLADWRAAYPGWTFRVTGGVLGGLALVEVAVDDLLWLVPLAAAVVMAFLLAMMRTAVGALATVLVLAASGIATLGAAGWSGVVLTAGTAISPLSVTVLMTASAIHVMLAWMRALDAHGPDAAPGVALSETLGALAVTNLTTAMGFLCLNFSDAPPLRQMGNVIAFGLAFGLVATCLVLPPMLRLDRRARAGQIPISAAMMRRLAGWILARGRLWLTVFPLLVGLGITGIARIGFDDSIFRYFDQRYEFRRDADAIRTRLSGLESMTFSMKAPEGGSVYDPDFLRRIDRFTTWLADQPGVISVGSIAGIVKRMHRAMNGGDPAFETVADSTEGNAQLMMFYEFSLPVGMDLTTSIDVAGQETRVYAALRADHAGIVRDLAASAEAWLAENEPAIAAPASGISVAFARLSERNNRQMLLGLAVVLAAISATMMATLRSVRLGAISLVPNLVPAVLAFGLWGYTFGDVNLGSTVVTTMTFGIVVDDTVHFLMHYRRRRLAGLAPRAAMEQTFSVVGSAIVITSLALIAGFSVMTLSGFVINQHIGALTVFVVGFALLADLLFLPALLMALDKEAT